MASDKQDKTINTRRSEMSDELATWLAPFRSGTFLSLQNTIGNRAINQLLQGDMDQHRQNGNGHSPKLARPLIVDDDAQLQPGQMRKTEFLDRLKKSVCGAAEELMRNTMWSELGCPYIDQWFTHYARQSGKYVEKALRKYAPEAANVASADDYIPIVTERVRRGLSKWAETGEMSGVPEQFVQIEMRGTTIQKLLSRSISGIRRAIERRARLALNR